MNVAIAQPSSPREIIVTLTRKGQVTIPVVVRRLLGMETECKLALVIDDEAKSVRLMAPRYPTIVSLVGAAGSLNRKLSWQETVETARADALAGKSHPAGHG